MKGKILSCIFLLCVSLLSNNSTQTKNRACFYADATQNINEGWSKVVLPIAGTSFFSYYQLIPMLAELVIVAIEKSLQSTSPTAPQPVIVAVNTGDGKSNPGSTAYTAAFAVLSASQQFWYRQALKWRSQHSLYFSYGAGSPFMYSPNPAANTLTSDGISAGN